MKQASAARPSPGRKAKRRKWLRGPRGTGFMYVRPGLESELEPAMLDQRGATWIEPDRYEVRADATRFELAEASIAGQLGLKAAADYLLELGPADVYAAVARKAERLRQGLASIPGVAIRDRGQTRSAIVSFTINRLHAAEVRDRLWELHVTVGTSDRHTTLLDMSARGLTGVVRASPHCFVSNHQLDQALEAVARVAATA